MHVLRPSIAAQTTEGDSAALRLSVIEIVLDSLASERVHTSRLWIRAYLSVDPGTRRLQRVPPTAEQLATIRSRFPTAAVPASHDGLFLCPPGVRVRMPGVGCPILEDGLIVEVGPLEIDADSAHASGSVIQSSTRNGRTSTWAQGVRLLFRRSMSGWKFVRVLGGWIT